VPPGKVTIGDFLGDHFLLVILYVLAVSVVVWGELHQEEVEAIQNAPGRTRHPGRDRPRPPVVNPVPLPATSS
jgi:hypothetical protein